MKAALVVKDPDNGNTIRTVALPSDMYGNPILPEIDHVVDFSGIAVRVNGVVWFLDRGEVIVTSVRIN